MALWVTGDDVQDIARREVSEESLVVAQEIVAMEAGVDADLDLDAGGVSSGNTSKLKRAVVFQAIWLESHPDALEAMDVTGVSQDGLSATYAAQNAHFLAPLAARFLRRLSWKLAPLRVAVPGTAFQDHGDRDDAERDDQFQWTPLGPRGGQVWR